MKGITLGGVIFLVLLGPVFGVVHASELSQNAFSTSGFEFKVDGQRLDGILDTPADQKATATIILVHGYGKTNVVEQNWFYDLRSQFASIGINTVVWDKPGCGRSEGVFDANQPVQSSAKEVVLAVEALQASGLAGTEKIGLWGISRAGWIAPLAMAADPSIAFWISVSGTDDKENFRYLLESNLPLEGRSKEQTLRLVNEWQARFNIAWQGGTFEESKKAGTNLDEDPFMKYLLGDSGRPDDEVAKRTFEDYQQKFRSKELLVDEEAELMVYVPEFKKLLSNIDRPVLAIFGEKDTIVDWRKTQTLYQETIGVNPKASLAVKTFVDANHNLQQSKTGALREFENVTDGVPIVQGYYEAMRGWLIELGFGKEL
ncbi:hypothetical protein NBRC116583_14820 [Arenicella sp. 4NH20-0111]|uniref:alpha/beta hydrolase family protein n=1 Tax=Arenicella sp. 4NH20-0111 TaxID=3127648 RepID=UPI00310C6651